MRRIIALVPNALGRSPGQRVRIEHWAQALQSDWDVEMWPFEDERLAAILYQPGRILAKAALMTSCFARQLSRVARPRHCDLLFISREAALVGPALIERTAARWGVPIVYDLDDPVFIPYRSPLNGLFSLLKFSQKTHALFRLSSHTTAISRPIAEYAASYAARTSVIPNAIDTDRYLPAGGDSQQEVRLCWIGSQSTLPNLDLIRDPLQRLQSECTAPVHIIAGPASSLEGVETRSIPWSAATEVASLCACHIGLVPVPEHPWSTWKFFYKTIQYMAVGLPVVAQRVGSNADVIQDGVNGFLVDTPAEWYEKLKLLVADAGLRRRLGRAARETIVEQYSSQRQLAQVRSVFSEAVGIS